MERAPPTRLSIRTLSIVFASAAAIMIAASAPASIIAAAARRVNADLSIAETRGTVWKGALAGVSAEGVVLGDIAYTTNVFSLLSGSLAADIRVNGGALNGNAKAALTPFGRLSVWDATFTFSLSAANRYALLGTPLQGTVRADVDHIAISKAGCATGSARLWTDVLVAPAKRFDSEAFDLAGEGVCEDGTFVVTLSGQGGEGAVSLSLRITPQLTYMLTAEAQPARREVADALQVLGFERANGVLTMGATGAIKTVGS